MELKLWDRLGGTSYILSFGEPLAAVEFTHVTPATTSHPPGLGEAGHVPVPNSGQAIRRVSVFKRCILSVHLDVTSVS